MNYNIVKFEDIPNGWTFYYLSESEQQRKCKKIGKHSFSWKEKGWTNKRDQAMPDEWYYVMCEKSYKKLME